MGPRGWRRVAAAMALAGAAAMTHQAQAERRPSARVRVELTGFRNDRGAARVAMWRSRDGFPVDASKAAHRFLVPIVDGRASLVVEAVEPGTWAFGAFHDENGNGRIDKNLLGIPKEGLGVSRDAKGRFGPPSFEDARLEVPPGERIVTFKVVYY